jgi:hypothetical protein
VATPAPEPTLTAEQAAAEKEAIKNKRLANGLPENEETPTATAAH